MNTPGPGQYNIAFKSWTKEFRKPIPMICFIAGSDICELCGKLLVGDYHKGKVNSWCHQCYQNIKIKPKSIHVRHCSFCHQHIGVPNTVCHTKKLAELRKLQRLEKIMFEKYGTSLD